LALIIGRPIIGQCVIGASLVATISTATQNEIYKHHIRIKSRLS